jgi:hypothetical protein
LTHEIPFHDFGGDGPVLHFAHANAYPPGCYQQFIAPFLAHYHVTAIYHRPSGRAATPPICRTIGISSPMT